VRLDATAARRAQSQDFWGAMRRAVLKWRASSRERVPLLPDSSRFLSPTHAIA